MVRFISFAFVLGLTTPALADDTPASWAGDPDDMLGFSLNNDWAMAWDRIIDRTGRPDPLGAIQQRFPDELYPEIEVDLLVGDYPLSLERGWMLKEQGARLQMHSINALDLSNHTQVKIATDMGGSGNRFILRLDRRTNAIQQTNLVRTDYHFGDPDGEGTYIRVSAYPRFEKDDVDLGIAAGYRERGLGDFRMRLTALDAGSNFSYALTSRRKSPPDGIHKQLDFPVALSFEATELQWKSLRAEAYVGAVIPQRRRLYFDELERNYVVKESAFLAGGMVEWKVPTLPLRLGSTGMAILTTFERRDEQEPLESRDLSERTYQYRAYAISRLTRSLLVEANARFTLRPETERYPGDPSQRTRIREDDEFIFQLRVPWMIGSAVGIELGYFYRNRDTSGPPSAFVRGSGNRIVTRALFKFGKVRATVGVGWDPDPRRSVYGGGGGNIIMDF